MISQCGDPLSISGVLDHSLDRRLRKLANSLGVAGQNSPKIVIFSGLTGSLKVAPRMILDSLFASRRLLPIITSLRVSAMTVAIYTCSRAGLGAG